MHLGGPVDAAPTSGDSRLETRDCGPAVACGDENHGTWGGMETLNETNEGPPRLSISEKRAWMDEPHAGGCSDSTCCIIVVVELLLLMR